MKSDKFYLFLLFSSVVSTTIFCFGFFPLAIPMQSKNENNQDDDILVHAKNTDNVNLDKTILMIIDALRLDFVDSHNFAFVHQLIKEEKACFLRLKTHLPTVTLPRITALTSGTIPSFMDVVLNLGDAGIASETFLHQIYAKNEKIVFAGDSTWTTLFKSYIFTRKYPNTDSLFVNDFHEGDKNVTKALKIELEKTDWKMLILHYLGLDHLGHVENPFSKRVPPKLKEMDEVIKLIYSKLPPKSILFVTSDHGMRDSGGHGSNSFAETHIPLLVIGTNCTSNTGFYNQIDFATTYSLMSGLPVPESSIGSVIPELLLNMSSSIKLSNLYHANKRLIDMIECDKNEDYFFQHEKAKKFHKIFLEDALNKNAYTQAESNYLHSSKQISERLVQASIRVDPYLVAIGLFCNVVVTLCIIIPTDSLEKDLKIKVKFLVGFVLFGLVFKVLVLNELFGQINDLRSNIVLLLMLLILFMDLGILQLKVARIRVKELQVKSFISYFIIFGHFLSIVSVASSSFVEEEHQIWYYMCNALFVILICCDLRKKTKNQIVPRLVLKLAFLMLHIIIRRLNKTGDKWMHLPDLSDWLQDDHNELWLQLVIGCSVALNLIYIMLFHYTKRSILHILIGIFIVYFFHTQHLEDRYISEFCVIHSTALVNCFWINIALLLLVNIIHTFYFDGSTKDKNKIKDYQLFPIFLLISALLHQPYNLILSFLCAFFNNACNRLLNGKEKTFVKIMVHFWTGKLFYFYQGNSNGLATIDVSAGYVGLEHYNIFTVGLFMTINTFNGQLISLFMLINNMIDDAQATRNTYLTLDGAKYECKEFRYHSLVKGYAILTSIPTTIFLIVITLLRHHLFIWSVFSPKLLYDLYFNFLMSSIMWIVSLRFESN
ncbi:unnamed protein product [Diamesa tonsa]